MTPCSLFCTCSMLTPSTPGAPSLAATRSHAARSTSGRQIRVVQRVKPKRRLPLGFEV